jgi:hypothetical protein
MVERPFLKVGSLYQNEYMSLQNDSGVAVSTTLRILEGERFELEVRSLDSQAGGSEGWIKFRGGFALEAVDSRKDIRQVVLRCDRPGEAIDYDEDVLHRGHSFAFGCLKRMARAVFDNLRLEVDTQCDTLLLRPQAPILRFFWDKPVDLKRTASPWMPQPAQAAADDPLSMFTPPDWPRLQEGMGVLATAAPEAPTELAVAF